MEIYLLEDFVPQYQTDAILEFIESKPTPSGTASTDEKVIYYAKQQLFDKNPFIAGLVSLISDRVRLKAESLFDCKLGDSGVSIAKTMIGHTPEEHADSQNMDGTPKGEFSHFYVSAVVYVNDNFSGGELVFPKIGYSYKPVSGSCIIFPSHVEYSHYVDILVTGERIVLPFWFPRIG
jgi:hypothetical protein